MSTINKLRRESDFNKVNDRVEFVFWNLTLFFIFNLKIHTSNLISPSFKVPSKSFFSKNFKMGLTF